MVSADHKDQVSSCDHAPRRTSSPEGSMSYPSPEIDSNHTESLVSRLFSTFFSVSSIASEASSPRCSRRRSFVPIISPTPGSPCQTVPSSSENLHRRFQHQNASPPTQEGKTNARGSQARARRRRLLHFGKFHEQLPRKALSAVYENIESLLRQYPRTDGASSASSAGTSSSGSHRGIPTGLSSIRQSRDRTFWESSPRRRVHQSDASPLFEQVSDSHDSGRTKRVANRRYTKGLASNAEGDFSSRTRSYYSSSGSFSPRYHPSKEAFRSPIPVPILDFSWLEKIATKRESRGLPPQPYMSRPVLLKKRASLDQIAKLTARLKKQQISILRELSSLATRRSVRLFMKVLSRRATMDTIRERERLKCFGATHRSSQSNSRVKTFCQPAPFYMSDNQRWRLGSFKCNTRARPEHRRFYSKVATPVRSRALNPFLAKKTMRQNISTSSLVSLESSEKLLLREHDKGCVTPKSPLSWLSQDERNSRMRSVLLEKTGRDVHNATVLQHAEDIIPPHRGVGRRRRRASCQRVAQASFSRQKVAHVPYKKSNSCGRYNCGLPESGFPVHSCLGDDSAKMDFPTVDLRTKSDAPSDHQRSTEDSAASCWPLMARKTIYSLSLNKSQNFLTSAGCEGLLIAVEPVLEGRRGPEGRRHGRRGSTTAIVEECMSLSPCAKISTGDQESSADKSVAVDSKEPKPHSHNVVAWDAERDELGPADTCECESELQKTHLCLTRSGRRRIQSAGSSTQRFAEKDMSPLMGIKQRRRSQELNRKGAFDKSADLKPRKESLAGSDNDAKRRHEEPQKNRQLTVYRQIMQEERWEPTKNQREQGTDASSRFRPTGLKTCTRIRVLQKEAAVTAAKCSGTGRISTKRQVFTAKGNGGRKQRDLESKKTVEVNGDLHQGAEIAEQLAASAEGRMEGRASKSPEKAAHGLRTISPVVVPPVQSEWDINGGQLCMVEDAGHNCFSTSGVRRERSSSFPGYPNSQASSPQALEQQGERCHTPVDVSSGMASTTNQQAKPETEAEVSDFGRIVTRRHVPVLERDHIRKKETAGSSGAREVRGNREIFTWGDFECGSTSEQNDVRSTPAPQFCRALIMSKKVAAAEDGGSQQHTSSTTNRATSAESKRTKGAHGKNGRAVLFNVRGGAARDENWSQEDQASPKERRRVTGDERLQLCDHFPSVTPGGEDQRETNGRGREIQPEHVTEGRQPPAERAADNGRFSPTNTEASRERSATSSVCSISYGFMQMQTEISAWIENEGRITAERRLDIGPTPTPLLNDHLQKVDETGVMSLVCVDAIRKRAKVTNAYLSTDISENFTAPKGIRNVNDVITVDPVNVAPEAPLTVEDLGAVSVTEMRERRIRARRLAGEAPQKCRLRMVREEEVYGINDSPVGTVDDVWTAYSDNTEGESTHNPVIFQIKDAFCIHASDEPASVRRREEAANLLVEWGGKGTSSTKEQKHFCAGYVRKQSASPGDGSLDLETLGAQANEQRKFLGMQEGRDISDTPEAELATITLEKQEMLPTVPGHHEVSLKPRCLACGTEDATSGCIVAPEEAAMDRDRANSLFVSESARNKLSAGAQEDSLERDATQGIRRKKSVPSLLDQTVEAALSHECRSLFARGASEVTDNQNVMPCPGKKDFCKGSAEVETDAFQELAAENAIAADEVGVKSLQETRTGEGVSANGLVGERSAAGHVTLWERNSTRAQPAHRGVSVVSEAGVSSSLLVQPTSQKRLEKGTSTPTYEHEISVRRHCDKQVKDCTVGKGVAGTFQDNNLVFALKRKDEPRTFRIKQEQAKGCRQNESARLPQRAKRSQGVQGRKAVVRDQTNFVKRPQQSQREMQLREPVAKEVRLRSAHSSVNTLPHDTSGLLSTETHCRDGTAVAAHCLLEEHLTEERDAAGQLRRASRRRIVSASGIEIDEAIAEVLAEAVADSSLHPVQQKRLRKCPEGGNFEEIRQKQFFLEVGAKKHRQTFAPGPIVGPERRTVTAEKVFRHEREQAVKYEDCGRNERSIGEPPLTEVELSAKSAISIRGKDSSEKTKEFSPELTIRDFGRPRSARTHQAELKSEDFCAVCSDDVWETTEKRKGNELTLLPLGCWGSTGDKPRRGAQKTGSDNQMTPAAEAGLITRDGAESDVPTARECPHPRQDSAAAKGKEKRSAHPTSSPQVQLARQFYADAAPSHQQRPKEQPFTRQDQERLSREAREHHEKGWKEDATNRSQPVRLSGKTATAVSSLTSNTGIRSGPSIASLDAVGGPMNGTTVQNAPPDERKTKDAASLHRDADRGVADKKGGHITANQWEAFSCEVETSDLSAEAPQSTETIKAPAMNGRGSEKGTAAGCGTTVKHHAAELREEVPNPAPDELPVSGAYMKRALYTAAAVDGELPNPGLPSSIDSKEVWVAGRALNEIFKKEGLSIDVAPSAILRTDKTEEGTETKVQACPRRQLVREDPKEREGKVAATRAASRAAEECFPGAEPLNFLRLREEREGGVGRADVPLNTSGPDTGGRRKSPVSQVVEGRKGELGKSVAGAAQQQLYKNPHEEAISAASTATETSVQLACQRTPESTSVSIVGGTTYGEAPGKPRLSGRETFTTASKKVTVGETADNLRTSPECERQQRCLRQSSQYFERSSKLAAFSGTTAETVRRGRGRGEHAVSGGELPFLGKSVAGKFVNASPQRASVHPRASLMPAKLAIAERTWSQPGQSPSQQHDLRTSATYSQKNVFKGRTATLADRHPEKRENSVTEGLDLTSQLTPTVNGSPGERSGQQEESDLSASRIDSSCTADTAVGRMNLSVDQAQRDTPPDKRSHVLLDSVPGQRRPSQKADALKRTEQVCKGDEKKQIVAAGALVRERREAADVPSTSACTALKEGEAWGAKEQAAARVFLRKTVVSPELVGEGSYVESLDTSAKMAIAGNQKEEDFEEYTPQRADVFPPGQNLIADAIVTTAQANAGVSLVDKQLHGGRAATGVRQNIRQHFRSNAPSVSTVKLSGQRAGDADVVGFAADTVEMRSTTIHCVPSDATECKNDRDARETIISDLSVKRKANATGGFPGKPPREEARLEQPHAAPVVELGAELERWDSTVCPSPPFSPRYIPPTCTPSRPAVPPLDLYWLRDRRQGPVQKKRPKNLAKTLHPCHVCEDFSPKIAAVFLEAEPPLQSDDDRKKADIVASLLVDDPVRDLDTDERKHQQVTSSYNGPRLPPVASTRSCVPTTPAQTSEQRSLDLEKSPELKAPRGEHPSLFYRCESAGAALAVLEVSTSNAGDLTGAGDDGGEKGFFLSGAFQTSARCRSRRQTSHPGVLGAPRSCIGSHTGKQHETARSLPPPVEAAPAIGRQKVVEADASTGLVRAAKTDSFYRAPRRSVPKRPQGDGSGGKASCDVSPRLHERNHLPQSGALEDEAAFLNRSAGLPDSSRGSVAVQHSARGIQSITDVKMNTQGEISYGEQIQSRDKISGERSEHNFAVCTPSLNVEPPILPKYTEEMPIDMNRREREKMAGREHSLRLTKLTHVGKKYYQERSFAVKITGGVRVSSDGEVEIAERPHELPDVGEAPSVDTPKAASDTPAGPSADGKQARMGREAPASEEVHLSYERAVEENSAGETETARTSRLRMEAAGGRALKVRSLKDASVAGREDNKTFKEVFEHTDTKPSLNRAQSGKSVGMKQTEARAKTQNAAENVLQLIKSAKMLLRANEAMGTWTTAALPDVTWRHDSQGTVADSAKSAAAVQEKRTAARPQRRVPYKEKLTSYEKSERKGDFSVSGSHNKRLHIEREIVSLEKLPAPEGLDKVSAGVCDFDGTKVSAPGGSVRGDAAAVCARSRTTTRSAPFKTGFERATLCAYPPVRIPQKESVVAERILSYEQMALRRQSVCRKGANAQNLAASLSSEAGGTKLVLRRGLRAAGVHARTTLTRAHDSLQTSVVAVVAAVRAPQAPTCSKSARGSTKASRTQVGLGAEVPAVAFEKGTEDITCLPSRFSGDSTGGAWQSVAAEVPQPVESAETATATFLRRRQQPEGGKDGFEFTLDQSQQPSEIEPLKTGRESGTSAFSPFETGPSTPGTLEDEAAPPEIRREKALLRRHIAVVDSAMEALAGETLFFRNNPSATRRQEGTLRLKDMANTSLTDELHQPPEDAVAVESPTSVQTVTVSPPSDNAGNGRRRRERPRGICRTTEETKLLEENPFSLTGRYGLQTEARLVSKGSVDYSTTESRPRRRFSSALRARISLTKLRGEPRGSVTCAATPSGARNRMMHNGGVSRKAQVLQEDSVAAEYLTSRDSSLISVDGGSVHIGEKDRCATSTLREKESEAERAIGARGRSKQSACESTNAGGIQNRVCTNGGDNVASKRATFKSGSPASSQSQDRKELQTDIRSCTEKLIVSAARLKEAASFPSPAFKKPVSVIPQKAIEKGSSIRDGEVWELSKTTTDDVSSLSREAPETARACRAGAVKVALHNSTEAAAAPEWYISKPLGLRTPVDVFCSPTVSFATRSAVRHNGKELSPQKTGSTALGLRRRASYQLKYTGTPIANRTEIPQALVCKLPGTGSRTCLLDSTAPQGRHRQERQPSVEEAKALFLQSWWKAVMVRKWLDAARCVRDFESSTSSVPFSSLLEPSHSDKCTEEDFFPYVATGDQRVYPPVDIKEARCATCVTSAIYSPPCSRRTSFADAFFGILAAEKREIQVKLSSTACSMSHSELFGGSVNSEPAWLRISQRLSRCKTDMTESPTPECRCKQLPRSDVVDFGGLPCGDDLLKENLKISSRVRVTVRPAGNSTTQQAGKKQSTEDDSLSHLLEWTLHAGERCQVSRKKNSGVSRYRVVGSLNRGPSRCLLGIMARHPIGGLIKDWWIEGKCISKKEGSVDHNFAEEGKQRDAHTTRGTTVCMLNQEAPTSQKLSEIRTASVEHRGSSGASTTDFLTNEPGGQRFHEEFWRRSSDKQELADHQEVREICEISGCSRQEARTTAVGEKGESLQLRAEGKTGAQTDRRLYTVTREASGQVPEMSHWAGPKQTACTENKYGDTKGGTQAPDIQVSVSHVYKGQKGSKEATKELRREPRSVGADRIEARDLVEVDPCNISEASLVKQDMEVQTPPTSKVCRQQENTPGGLVPWLQDMKAAVGSENVTGDGGGMGRRENHLEVDPNILENAEVKFRSPNGFCVASRNCRQHLDRQASPLECVIIQEEGFGPAEHDKQDVTYSSVRSVGEQKATCCTESEAQDSAPLLEKQKSLHFSAGLKGFFPPHASYETLSSSQDADRQSHRTRVVGRAGYVVVSARLLEKRTELLSRSSPRRYSSTRSARRSSKDHAGGCKVGHSELETFPIQPCHPGLTVVSRVAAHVSSDDHATARVAARQKDKDMEIQRRTNTSPSNPWKNKPLRERQAEPLDHGDTCKVAVSDKEELLSSLYDDEGDPIGQLVKAKKDSAS